MFRNVKLNLVLIAIISVAILFMINNYVLYAVIAIGFGVLVYLLWNVFLKNRDLEIRKLKQNIVNKEEKTLELQRENEELRARRLNVSEIRHIIELSLIELHTSFTRTYKKEIDKDDKKLKFLGALKVQMIAKYGIDLNEMKLYFPENENVIRVANVSPRFMSFSSRKFTWELAELLEYKERVFGSDFWRDAKHSDNILSSLLEEKRVELENEIDNGAEELDWITGPLKKQIITSLELLLETSGRRVELVDHFDERYVGLKELTD